jgi:predicted ribosomally synthesized peptide with nif11-like leader
MSEEAARAFIEKMKSDEAFRARVMAEEDVEARMALIGAEGFDCSAEDIAALEELGEAELSGVAGGACGADCHCQAGWCLGSGSSPGWDAGRG